MNRPLRLSLQQLVLRLPLAGLKVDDKGSVLDNNDRSISGLFAAGELVGGLFYENYPGGSGLMAGAVYGKIAGENPCFTCYR
ncbi:MAG: hypothetical protein CM15mP62_20140 [Rhodospirillaceae bacterium]|nr:MAG: hypothetical protein CM15mP62_20140 [Rhodospirillaceae bacterium]